MKVKNMRASKYTIRSGVGQSDKQLSSFDKALWEAGVGNYNLVKLSSILPAGCKMVEHIDLTEGSLLPTAFSRISSAEKGTHLVSSIGVGIPKDDSCVGVIMEHSTIDKGVKQTLKELVSMIEEAFEMRGCELREIKSDFAECIVRKDGETCTTFACIAEW